MAPRKRTLTEKPEPPSDITPKMAAKPKATKPAAKKPAKAEPKALETPAKRVEPAKKKVGRPTKVAAAPEGAPEPRITPKAISKKKLPFEPVVESRASAPAKKIELPRPLPTFTSHAKKVMESIAEGQAIELIFLDGDAYPPRTFEARQLLFDVFTGSWFAWGWDRRYNAERHHRLDLLAEINPVESPGRSAQGPFPEGTPANQIGGWRGGEPIPVKAVLQKQWIFAVKQAPAPFPDFCLEDLDDGKAQVTFTGTDLRAIARWCMQFGDGIQVQEPQRLVDRIKQVGLGWAGKAVASPMPPPAPRAHSKPEPRPEPKPEARPEPRRHEVNRKESREPRETKEPETPKGKPARVEIRIERL
jgi:hypothetical protein